MRGSPPLQIFAFLLAFAGFAVPLSHLTFARPVVAARPVVVRDGMDKTTPTFLRLHLAHVPSSLSVTLDGKELIQGEASKSLSSESKVQIGIPPEGVELMVNATWPAGTPDTALSVELEPDSLETQSQTRWSSGGSLSEVLTYNWKS